MIYDTFYAKLVPNGAVTGTKYSVSISGVTAIVDGQKTYTGADMYYAITPKSSGNATVTFRNDTTGDVIGTRPILIRSTTLAVPTYTLTASATSVNEGGTVTFSIDTSDVPVGTNIAYAITGVSVADISLGSLTGNFVVTADGSADLPITITNDALSEGTETLTLTLTGKGLSKAVTINDTSLTPTYNVGWYSNSTGTTAITNANEGSTAYLVVKTTNVANGTVLPVTLSGTGVNASDFSTGAMTGNITINNNIGYLTYTLANDLTTEGAETITATVKSGSTTVGTNTLVINDTSKTPVSTGIATFTVGTSPDSGAGINYGVATLNSASLVTENMGQILNDDLKINSNLLSLYNCNIFDGGSYGVSLWFDIVNRNVIETLYTQYGEDNVQLVLGITNLRTNASINITTLKKFIGSATPYYGWSSLDQPDIYTTDPVINAALRRIFVVGDNVKITLTYNII